MAQRRAGARSDKGTSVSDRPPTPDGAAVTREAFAETLDVGDVPAIARAVGVASPPHEGDATLERGTMLSDSFRVDRVLGQGGMGVVYVVEHVDLGRHFAAKVVGQRVGSDALARLRKEARIASGIRHPNIVDVVHLGSQDDGPLFVVMELLEGEDLGQRLDRQAEESPDSPWLPIPELRSYASQMFAGLAAAHAGGVVHRDLKPDNVFLSDVAGARVVKLLDFGIAKAVDPQRDHRLTRTGQIIGTPLYMAPEQARSTADVDERADLYSMGVILYEMVAGAPPFEAGTIYDLIVRHATQPPTPPREHRPDLPEPVEKVILRCLEKKRDDRFASVGELAQAWEEAWDQLRTATPSSEPAATVGAEHEPAAEETTETVTRRAGSAEGRTPTKPVAASGRVPLALAALGLLAVAGAGTWWAAGRGDPEPPATAIREVEHAEPPVVTAAPPTEAPVAQPVSLTREVTSDPPGAEVTRDGLVVGTTPFGLEVLPGESVDLVVRAAGYEPSTVTVDAESAAAIAVELIARPTPRARRPRPQASREPAHTRPEPPTENSEEPERTPEPPRSGGLLVGMDAFDAERDSD